MDQILKSNDYSCRVESDLNGEDFFVISVDGSRYLKISPKIKLIIDQFDGNSSKKEIIDNLEKIGISVSYAEIDYFLENYLIPNGIVGNSKNDLNESKLHKRKNNLWLHIPIVESSKFNKLYSVLKHLLANEVVVISLLIITAICMSFCMFFSLKLRINGDNFANSILIIFLIYVSMFVHEIGHATAAYKYNVPIGKIGIGIYLMYFVFFVDMTNIWQLSRRKRMINDLSGIYFQALTIIPIFILYLISNNHSYLISCDVIFFATVMNLSPFLRMDGYWFLSDYFSIQNIHIKVFESIKKLFYEIFYLFRNKLQKKDYMIQKSVLIYGIYSGVYFIATLVMFIIIGRALVDLIINRENVFLKINIMFEELLSGRFMQFIVLFNQMFILFIPFIFILGIFIPNMKKLINKIRD